MLNNGTGILICCFIALTKRKRIIAFLAAFTRLAVLTIINKSEPWSNILKHFTTTIDQSSSLEIFTLFQSAIMEELPQKELLLVVGVVLFVCGKLG